jgi:hypothetical protein
LRHRREDSARQTRPEVFSGKRLEPLNALLYMMAFGKRRMIQLISATRQLPKRNAPWQPLA